MKKTGGDVSARRLLLGIQGKKKEVICFRIEHTGLGAVVSNRRNCSKMERCAILDWKKQIRAKITPKSNTSLVQLTVYLSIRDRAFRDWTGNLKSAELYWILPP